MKPRSISPSRILLSLSSLLAVALLAGCNSADAGSGELAACQRRITDLEAELSQTKLDRDRAVATQTSLDGRLAELTRSLTAARTQNTELQNQVDLFRDQIARMQSSHAREIEDLAHRQPQMLEPQIEGASSYTDEHGVLHIAVDSEVLFQPGSEIIGKSGAATLDRLLAVLNEQYPSNAIEIAGHTDNDPIKRTASKWKTNMELSLQRAHSVYAYLSSKGLAEPKRVRAAGYGEFRPVADNDSKENKRRNRRVEVLVFP